MEMTTTLTDGQIEIRPCRPEDAEAICEAVRESIAEVSPWAPWCSPDYDLPQCREWLEGRSEAWAAGEEYDFEIRDVETGCLLGGCGLNQVNRTFNFANLGYWVRTSRVGQGVAARAARLVARFGFEQIGFTRLEIVVSVGNQASQRVADKVGATKEGRARNRYAIHGRIEDAFVFSLVPEDFQIESRISQTTQSRRDSDAREGS